MKKNYLTLLFLFFGALFINAQSNYFYYYKGQKIYLTLDKTKLSIITNSQFEKNSISNLFCIAFFILRKKEYFYYLKNTHLIMCVFRKNYFTTIFTIFQGT